jgi:hypothetical protein
MVAVAGYSQAQPNTLGAIAPNGAVITLTQEVGPCKNGAKVATYLAPNKKDTVNGCWKISENAPVVSIAWFDGDGSAIPVQVFKPISGV